MYTYICLQLYTRNFSCMRLNTRIAKGSSRFLAVKPTAFQIKWIHVLLREDLQLKTYTDLQSVHPVSRLWLIPYNEGNKQVCESVNNIYILRHFIGWYGFFLLFMFALFWVTEELDLCHSWDSLCHWGVLISTPVMFPELIGCLMSCSPKTEKNI